MKSRKSLQVQSGFRIRFSLSERDLKKQQPKNINTIKVITKQAIYKLLAIQNGYFVDHEVLKHLKFFQQVLKTYKR